jgi:glycosyl transferase family 25
MTDSHAYVISLKSGDRRATLERKLSEAGIDDWEYVDAVDIRGQPAEAVGELFDAAAFERQHHRPPIKGEIGCALSHRLAIARIVDSGAPGAFIFEDDVVFYDSFEQIRCVAGCGNERPTIVILGYVKIGKPWRWLHYLENPVRTLRRTGAYRLGRIYKQYAYGSVGYFVNGKAARVMNDSGDKAATVSDDWAHVRQLGIEILHVRPFLVGEDIGGHASSMEHERSDLRDLSFHLSNNHLVNVAKGLGKALVLRRNRFGD